MLPAGRPAARHRLHRRHVDRAAVPAADARRTPSATRSTRSTADKVVQRLRPARAEPDHGPPADDARVRSRAPTSRRASTRSTEALQKANIGRLPGHQQGPRRADRRRGPAEQGHLGDAVRARRHPPLRRVPVPLHVRGGRDRRDVPRHPHHARVPELVPLRPVAQRHRRDPDDHRLLGERHDRRLRPRAREPAAACGASRSTRSSTRA